MKMGARDAFEGMVRVGKSTFKDHSHGWQVASGVVRKSQFTRLHPFPQGCFSVFKIRQMAFHRVNDPREDRRQARS